MDNVLPFSFDGKKVEFRMCCSSRSLVSFREVHSKEDYVPTKPVCSVSPNAVPLKYAGKWVVWNSDHSQIVGSADTVKDVWRIAREGLVIDPIFEKVPRSDVRFVGMR